MGSLLRSIKKSKKRKKSRRLGEVNIVKREDYEELEVDSKVEMIRALIPLSLMHIYELLDKEVIELPANDTPARRRRSVVNVTAATRARLGLVVSEYPSGFRGFAAQGLVGRFHYALTTR